MCQFVCKQSGQKTRDFIAHLRELNNYLPKFPPVNPGEVPKALHGRRVLDLLEFGVPMSWQREMVRQEFDPLQHTLNNFIAFCECMEAVEQADRCPSQSPSQNSNRNNKLQKHKHECSTTTTDGSTKSCILHGECGHSTDECHILRCKAKHLKLHDVPTKCNSDEHQRACPKSSSNSTKELCAMIEEAVERAVNNPTRKAKTTGDELDLKAFEQLSMSDDNSSDTASQRGSNNSISKSLNDYFALSTICTHRQKCLKTEDDHLAPITFARLNTRPGMRPVVNPLHKDHMWKYIKVLLDSGASSSIIAKDAITKLSM